MKIFLKNNGLCICFLILFIGSLAGQIILGFNEHNKELIDEGASAITFASYLTSGHFFQSTFENWESEFLQMALFVLLTIFLKQKGSSESKKIDEPEEVDREPDPTKKDSPWPVKKGGFILKIYKHSLTIVLFILFVISFVIHFFGSLKDENEQLSLKGEPLETISSYIGNSRFWFESFQNWQSEFLSVFAIIMLSIYLRQIGSSQSKPVDAPHAETGG
ncbi:hypothetical protein ASE21_11715 [Flavobacterium sp. Root901]|uniref:DUF6766 family protein n=1 Tax=Flavobacterium sp. Root901 TaxID=1736605 RepID=UPI000709E714|nr:DUF6766 family protein [Flavobacterium sp. Root901]KRD10369.1 hypothetical protein ASE21_11715 [Flavobacterium sp. Root901]